MIAPFGGVAAGTAQPAGAGLDNQGTAALACTAPDPLESPMRQGCAVPQDDGSFAISPAILPILHFDVHDHFELRGLAPILIDKVGYALVRRDGRALHVKVMDNGPDWFEDGLVRVLVGGKVGFADQNLHLIIPAIYDGAYQFRDGRALVCTGCVLVSDGEGHSHYEGGRDTCLAPDGAERPLSECGR